MKANTKATAAAQSSARPDCYVGIKPCGCMVAWVHDNPKHQKDTAKVVARYIRDGYRVEAAITDDIRSKLGPCRCESPNDPSSPATVGEPKVKQ